ncbi:MAG TPA: molybdate ABC transporter substrate-binding protein [Deferrisomatales bacterium]|nr:molybdate ABC transporter substrate-binding protein [Deferrisomatales bacterium]
MRRVLRSRRCGHRAALQRLFRSALAASALLMVSPAAGEGLLVSAAASLTNAVGAVARQFEAANPGVTVVCNFAGSGTLLRQLEQGAPVDVFAAADQTTMDQAQQAGLILPRTRATFATNTLVLITRPIPGARPGGGPVDRAIPHSMGIVTRPIPGARPEGTLAALLGEGRELLAVGNPKFVPVGRYARQALNRGGLWERLEGRLVLGNSARQVLDYVARGEVGAGVVYATDAMAAGDRVRVVGSLQGHRPIVYPAAVTAASGQPQLARRFMGFLCGDTGQEILARKGFGPPPSDIAAGPSRPADG